MGLISVLARIEVKKVRDKSFNCHRLTKDIRIY
jgi:hypothetical protein